MPPRAQRSVRTEAPPPGAGRSPPPTVLPKVLLKQHPRPTPGWSPKEGPTGPSFGCLKGVWGEIEIPPEFFLGSARGYSFNSERIPPRKPPIFIGSSAPAGTAGDPRPRFQGPKAAELPRHPRPARRAGHPDPKPQGVPGPQRGPLPQVIPCSPRLPTAIKPQQRSTQPFG